MSRVKADGLNGRPP